MISAPDIFNKTELAPLLRKHHVKSLHAFGSVCSARFTEESDIDLLVSFDDMPLLDYADNYFDLRNALQELLGKPIDLVVDKSVKNPYLKKSIEKQKVKIYG